MDLNRFIDSFQMHQLNIELNSNKSISNVIDKNLHVFIFSCQSKSGKIMFEIIEK